MKKIYLLIFVLIFSSISVFSFETVDMNKIKNAITDENSEFFYPKLFERYSNHDTTLNLEQYRHLYYGHALQPYYNPTISRMGDSARTLRQTLNSSNPDFKRVAELARFVLRLDPFSIDAMYILGIAYEILGEEKYLNIFIDKFTKIVQTVLMSGDGKTPETAFTVVSLSDEYAFLNAVGLKSKEQALVEHNGKFYDLITLEKSEEIELDSVYFNIELYYGKGLNIKR